MQKKSSSFWEDVVNEIIGILHKYTYVLEGLKKKSSFFNILSYDETCNVQLGLKEGKNKTRQRITLLDIFSPKYFYAIVQERKAGLKIWKQHLIQLSFQTDIVEKILELQFIRKEKERKGAETAIQMWGKEILKCARNFEERIELSDDSKQQFIVKWLLKSMPAIGVFSDKTGNIRVNILSIKTVLFLYVNENFKLLVLQRLLEVWKKDGIRRFSIYTWYSNRYLACKKLPYKIFHVRRGYFSEFSLAKTIIPLNDTELKKVSDVLIDNNGANFLSIIRSLYRSISLEEYRKSIRQTLSYQIDFDTVYSSVRDIYIDLVYNIIIEACAAWEYEDWEKLGLEETKQFDNMEDNNYKIFKELLLIHHQFYLSKIAVQEYKERMKDVASQQEFWRLCKAWLYISYHFSHITNQKLEIPAITKEYFSNLESEGEAIRRHRRICDYVKNNGYYQISFESLNNCCKQFAEELFSLFEQLEMRKRYAAINRIPNEKNKDLLKKIRQFFEMKREKQQ